MISLIILYRICFVHVFSAFFEFLGPVVHHLNYWGSKEKIRVRSRRRKLDPKNQLFLVLVKLKLNLKLTDLEYRFGLSSSLPGISLHNYLDLLFVSPPEGNE